jgi:hypothetical protein
MKIKLALVWALAIGVLVICGPAFAHHGNAAYDMSTIAEFKNATVTKWVWANPHCILMFDVKDDKGNVVHWTAETGSPEAILPFGFNRDVVHTGDEISVYLFKSKAGTPVGIVNRIVLSDGRVVKDVPLGGTEADREEARKNGKGALTDVSRQQQQQQ